METTTSTNATDRRPHGNPIATALALLPLCGLLWWAVWHYGLSRLF